MAGKFAKEIYEASIQAIADKSKEMVKKIRDQVTFELGYAAIKGETLSTSSFQKGAFVKRVISMALEQLKSDPDNEGISFEYLENEAWHFITAKLKLEDFDSNEEKTVIGLDKFVCDLERAINLKKSYLSFTFAANSCSMALDLFGAARDTVTCKIDIDPKCKIDISIDEHRFGLPILATMTFDLQPR